MHSKQCGNRCKQGNRCRTSMKQVPRNRKQVPDIDAFETVWKQVPDIGNRCRTSMHSATGPASRLAPCSTWSGLARVPRILLVEEDSTNHCTWRSHNHALVLDSDDACRHFLS